MPRISTRILVSFFVLLRLLEGSPAIGQADSGLPKSREDVIRLYGKPTGAVTAGAKEILTYPERKVLLSEGQVTSITAATPPVSTSIALPAPPVGAIASPNLRYLRPPRGSFRLSYDPAIWVPQNSKDPEHERFGRSATHVSGYVGIKLNTENASFVGHDLAAIVLDRVRATDPDFILKKKETVRIKGGDAIHLRVQAKSQGILNETDFYIHSSAKGTAQLMVSGTPEGMAAFAADVAAVPAGLEIISINTPEFPEGKSVVFSIPQADLNFAYDPRDWAPATSESNPKQRTLKFLHGDITTVMEKYPPSLTVDDVLKLFEKQFGEREKIEQVSLKRETMKARGGQLRGGRLLTAPGANQRCCYIYVYDNPSGIDSIIIEGLHLDVIRYFQNIQQIVTSMAVSPSR